MILTNATIWPGDGTAFDGYVEVDNGRITHVGRGAYAGPSGTKPIVDLEGLALSPGMVDLMVLSGFGLSILEDERGEIAARYLQLGVTACQFCAGTRTWEQMAAITRNVTEAQAADRPDAARVLGVYWEGPFQHPEATGASLASLAQPATQENIEKLLALSGDVMNMINISPGIDGAAKAVAAFVAAGKVVSMAHSYANDRAVAECLDAGTTICGHCWNNNNGGLIEMGVQQPMLDHMALTDDRIRFVHIICDGVHVHPVLVRMTHRCRGIKAICLVTDAVRQAGEPDGDFTHNDGRTFTKRGGVGRTDTGALCGSALLLPDHLRNFIRFTGRPAHEAIRTVTLNPATSLGLDDQLGAIRPGLHADLVAWDKQMRVARVWKAGREVENVQSAGEVTLD